MSMKLVPYKFEIVAVCHVLDDEGRIASEQNVARQVPNGGLEPVVVFGVEGLQEWANGFQDQLDRINTQADGPTRP